MNENAFHRVVIGLLVTILLVAFFLHFSIESLRNDMGAIIYSVN